VSVGEALAGARRQAGLSVAQVSQRTRIREAIIHGIENDDYSACGGHFYARGHIRGIAKVTEVDPGPLIREYDTDHRAPQTLTLAEIFPDSPATQVKTRGQPWLNRGMAVAAVAALLMALGFVASGLLSGSRHAGAATPQARAHPRPGPGRRADAVVPARPPARPSTLAPVSAAAAGPAGGSGTTAGARPAGDRPRSHPRARQLGHHHAPREPGGGHRPAPELGPPGGDRRHADRAWVSAAHRDRARPGRHAAHRVRGPRGPRHAAAV
jgi:Helix-turn-helix domain